MHKCGLAKRVTSTFEGQTESFARNSKADQKSERVCLQSGPFYFISMFFEKREYNYEG